MHGFCSRYESRLHGQGTAPRSSRPDRMSREEKPRVSGPAGRTRNPGVASSSTD